MGTDEHATELEVRRREDGSWDLVRRGDQDEVLSNHPLQSMAESERHRLAQQEADDQPGQGDEGDDRADLGTIASYPDNVGG